MKKWLALHKVELVLCGLGFLLIFVFLAPSIFISIQPGEAGVVWLRFGGGTITEPRNGDEFRARLGFDAQAQPIDSAALGNDAGQVVYVDYPYSEGLRLKFPWDKMYIYDVRLQEHQVQYDVLAKDGLNMKVSISIRWKPIEADLGKLHKDIGPDYLKTLIIPLVGSFARKEIGQFDADDLYAEQRQEIQDTILSSVQEAMVNDFYHTSKRESLVRIEDILIREIVLPPKVRDAIQDKVEQKHLADAYEYRLQREVQEADRKEIEAQGIRRFQEEINGSITQEFLRWKGIDATLELAKSSNAKIVVIGAGDEGMPIILGGLDSPTQVSGDAPEPETEIESDIETDADADIEADVQVDTDAEPAPVADNPTSSNSQQ